MSIALHMVLQNIHGQQEEHLHHMRQQRRAKEEAAHKKVKAEQGKNNGIKTEDDSDESFQLLLNNKRVLLKELFLLLRNNVRHYELLTLGFVNIGLSGSGIVSEIQIIWQFVKDSVLKKTSSYLVNGVSNESAVLPSNILL